MYRVLMALVLPVLLVADKAGSKEERLKKTRTDLQSSKVEVRRAAIGSLVHSDLSDSLAADIQAALQDRDWKVRETAATATGNLGKLALPAVPDLLKQLEADPMKGARETAA